MVDRHMLLILGRLLTTAVLIVSIVYLVKSRRKKDKVLQD